VPERVVITGLGVVAPNANGTRDFSSALREGKSGIRFLPELRELGYGCQVGGIPGGFDELKQRYLDDPKALGTNLSATFAAIAAIEAWTDAGFARPAPGSRDVDWESGAIVGTGCGAMDTTTEKLVPLVDEQKWDLVNAALFEQVIPNSNSALVGALLALGNRVSTNASACTTGNEAVVEAFRHIRAGRAKRMLAGGSEGPNSTFWAGSDVVKVLSRTHNDEPERASRPMSATAAGFVPSAGAGMLVLESLSFAQARGARIYAEVLAGEINCGGHRMGGSMSAPNAEGVRRCIRSAVAMAGIRPDDVDAINGHLTATFADPQEVECWSSALGLPPSKMPLIQATKSLIGHALGAAGGIECVATILQLDEGFVHGSVNCEDLHPLLAAYAERIPHKTLDVPHLKVMAKASFGFGDVNACIFFRKFEP
jgi:3-oxoacyl-(acyl-carrier-protein) synthase